MTRIHAAESPRNVVENTPEFGELFSYFGALACRGSRDYK
jgi:hypothetical protein